MTLLHYCRKHCEKQKYFVEIQHNRNYESELVDYLLAGYNRQARPVKDISKPVNVTIGLNMGKLIDLVSTFKCLMFNP